MSDSTIMRARSSTLVVAFQPSLSSVLAGFPGASIERMFTRPEAVLAAEKARIETESRRQHADKNLYYRVVLTSGTDAAAVIDALNALSVVEIAYAEPLPQPVPVTLNFEPEQGYRDEVNGIDIDFARTHPGGTGGNVTIIDIEYDWRTSHEDLTAAVGGLIPNGSLCDPFGGGPNPSFHHGTAVLGELIATDNGFGVTGMVPDAGIGMVNAAANPGCVYLLEQAIDLAAASLTAGDLILIEQQIGGPASGCSGLIAVEWIQAYYDAIAAAVAAGIIVVEAAGNGGCDYDNGSYGFPFPAGRPDSGAIIVGAGTTPGGTAPIHSRLGFSSHGTRVDARGWGERVVTTGYGDHPSSPAGANELYTDTFGGTSSASPIVTAAAAILSSAAQEQGFLLTPTEIRHILRTTGTPQDTTSAGALSGNIGPLPDMREAIPAAAPYAVDDQYTVNPGGTLVANAIVTLSENESANDGFGAAAQNLDPWFGRSYSDYVGNQAANTSTVFPHVSVVGFGDGSTRDIYTFTVPAAGMRGIFDIDFGHDPAGGGSFDSLIWLYNSATTQIAASDDAGILSGALGSISPLDSFLEYTFVTPGTYYIEVQSFGHAVVPAGATYSLQVSVEGASTPHEPTRSVLRNDRTIGGNLNAVLITPPAHGSLTFKNDGSFIYTHNGDSALQDTFTYRAVTGSGASSVATATILILRTCQGKTATIQGTDGDDTIHGTNGADVIYAGAGNDTVFGNGGGDTICLGDGNDTGFGGNGNDRVTGGSGVDVIDGGPGRDVLNGGAGRDDITGRGGKDTLLGGGGADSLDGGGGPDLIRGGTGNDDAVGGPGNDRLLGQVGNDELDGGGQRDVLIGGGGKDTLDGGPGNDKLKGSSGDDTLLGGAGVDTGNGGPGADTCVVETKTNCEL